MILKIYMNIIKSAKDLLMKKFIIVKVLIYSNIKLVALLLKFKTKDKEKEKLKLRKIKTGFS